MSGGPSRDVMMDASGTTGCPLPSEPATHGEGRVLLGPQSFSKGTAGGRTGVNVCVISFLHSVVVSGPQLRIFPEISKGEDIKN